jgi:hypothetical protein
MLGHADKQVRDAASRALVSMGAAVIPLLQDIRAAGPGRARPAALYCLAEIGGDNALGPPRSGWASRLPTATGTALITAPGATRGSSSRPPLDGWTLLIGPWCNPVDAERRGDVLKRCVRASAVSGRAQAYWFAAQGDGSAWLVAENGTLVRCGASAGDDLDEEITLGPRLPYEAEVLAAEPGGTGSAPPCSGSPRWSPPG